MNTQTYTVNIRTGVVNITRVDVSQGDTGRTLAFKLYDGPIPFTPPTGSAVKIVGRKPSGLGFSETCTVSGNTAVVNTTLAMTQEAGKFPVELRIESDTRSIGTANFVLHVEPSPHPAGTTDGTTEEARTVLAQCEAYAELAQEAAEAASGDYTEIKSDVEDLEDRVEALESGGGGSGLTDAIKTALMNLVNHLAWDDDDPTGQTYITALYNALYPPADLVSISAVYTQSGAIYETNDLDDLKEDLVVTALMSDQTTRPVTDYTLSGTLTEGTSTITVSYGGKTTTFTVTVSHEAVYTRQVAQVGAYITTGKYASNPNAAVNNWNYDLYSINNVKAGDVINLVVGWNESVYTGNEKRHIATTAGAKPNITNGTFVKHGTSYGEIPVTINEDYETLYVNIMNTNNGGYMSLCTWTREGGF